MRWMAWKFEAYFLAFQPNIQIYDLTLINLN